MKKSKKLPYIFLLFLFIVMIFLLGIKYGKKVEQTNKVVDYFLSITPTKPVTPQPDPSIIYLTFQHEGCGIEFLYPSYLKKEKESSQEAHFVSSEDERIDITCAVNRNITPTMKDDKVATESIQFKGRTIIAQKKTDAEILHFNVLSQDRKNIIYIQVDKKLFPLFEKTFAFIQ